MKARIKYQDDEYLMEVSELEQIVLKRDGKRELTRRKKDQAATELSLKFNKYISTRDIKILGYEQ